MPIIPSPAIAGSHKTQRQKEKRQGKHGEEEQRDWKRKKEGKWIRALRQLQHGVQTELEYRDQKKTTERIPVELGYPVQFYCILVLRLNLNSDHRATIQS